MATAPTISLIQTSPYKNPFPAYLPPSQQPPPHRPSHLASLHLITSDIRQSAMHLVNLIATFLLIWAARASPRDQEATSSPCTESQYGATTTIEGSLTVTTFSRSTAASTSTSVGPLTLPTSALTVVAARSSSPIHFAPMNAAGLRFYLGAQTLSFCPSEVVDEGACPTGNETAFGLCNMVTMTSL